MQTIDDVIKANALYFKVERSPTNPQIADDQWAKTATHWYYKIINRSAYPIREMSGYFSMGSGHKGKTPQLRDVLDCLASDASGYCDHFETWASEYGYDTDSRKAYAIWESVREQTQQLKALLGEAFEDAIYAERL